MVNLSGGIKARSREINCTGASGMTIGPRGAFGSDVSDLTCWQIVQDFVKILQYANMFGK